MALKSAFKITVQPADGGFQAELADAADKLARKSGPFRPRARPLPYAPRQLRDRARDNKPELEAATAPSSGPEAELAYAGSELARKSGPRRGRPLPYVPRRLQHPVRDKEPEIRAEAATPADFTAPSSHFGRNWLWRAASASSFVSAAAVIGILGLSLLQSPLRPHLLTPTHAGGTAAQAATAMTREVGTDPVNITAPLTTRAPADGAQPAAPKTYPSESSALPPVHSAKPPESASLKTSEPQLPLPETAPPNASPSERIRPVRNRLRHAERREGAAVGGRRVNRQEVVAGRPRRGR
jgi:hypothetical protein